MAYIPGSLTQKSKSGLGTYTPGTFTQKSQSTTGYIPGSSSKRGLDTSSGLYNLATQAGLKSRADSLLAQQSGEIPNKIYSGGIISDIFDTLNALQYGVVGTIKGKGFIEGVKTRQSFTDKDALGDKGIPGLVVGTLLDIAVDPLTYVAPATIVKKVPVLAKLAKGLKTVALGEKVIKTIDIGAETGKKLSKTYEAVEGGSKIGRYLAQKLSWMQGADPVFRNTFERGLKNTAISTQKVVDLIRGLTSLTPSAASKLLRRDETGRFIRVGIDELSKTLKPDEFEAVSKMYNKIDNLGKEAVDLGLLSKAKYEDNIGEYIKNAYTDYELGKSKGIFGKAAVGIKGIKARVAGLTPEQMIAKGQIDNPAYLMFKSAIDLSKDVENAKMFKIVAEKFGTDVAQDGFTKLPSGTRLGSLAGKYVPDNMATYLKEVYEPSANTIQKQLVNNFKFFKVVMNPGTHARNIISNKILNYWKLGMNPLDPRVIKSDVTALKEISKGVGKWSDEARPLGYNLDTFASAEMKGLLDSPEAMGLGKKLGSTWGKVKKTLGDMYQAEENAAKLSAYIFQRTVKNLKPEDAWKAAESATFNYAQVTPFVRKLRESMFGFPFITFTVKSTPVALETAYKTPQRISVIGKIKQAIEQQADIKETEKERANEPSWVKDGFYVKLPIKDKEGRSAYFDLTYILPFGDIMSGNFFERGQNMKTGTPQSIPETLMNKSPFIQLVGSIYKNRDFYGNSIWKDTDSSDKQLTDLMTYLTKAYVPPLIGDQLPGGYNEKGERQNKGIVSSLGASAENQKRNLMQELLRNVGAKIQPIDADIQETYTEWNKKKALERLLIENGVLDEFTRTYKPKK
jgi:hypothetical protein